MLYLASGFSFDMLPPTAMHIMRVPVTREEVRALLMAAPTFQSVIRSESVAQVLSEVLGYPVPAGRFNVELRPGDMLLVSRPERGRDVEESRSFTFFAVRTEDAA